jgi:hypothetical protein
MKTDIYKPIIGWSKYQSNEESFIPEAENKRADKLKTKYAITPDILNLEIDTETYSQVRKNFFGND